ncbi:MAG: pentapeptide repeat-containing protein [Chloracidobacterium sp.]|nr:pentapeptide repeat-containing protein [Chloracidobacterium sp.]
MRTEIRNTKGEIIFESDEPLDRAYLEDRDLSDAMFENANLEGICWMGTVLRNANLKNADLYWASLFTSDLSGANLEMANLQGADLKEVNLRGANLRSANLGLDNLGGSTQLEAADLRDVTNANFNGARYDSRTKFPDNFDPQNHNMVFGETG